jgi:hydrophobic/amphiphilic exporter-1 (mainly G- bacteria), HAE1 family
MRLRLDNHIPALCALTANTQYIFQPLFIQGSGSNTIATVDWIRKATPHLLGIPQQLETAMIYDQSVFVKAAIENVISEGVIGVCLTRIMILLPWGSIHFSF